MRTKQGPQRSRREEDDSLKGTTRANRGKGVRRRLVGNAAVPVNCQTFLQVDSRPFCRLTATRQNYSVSCLQAVCKEDKEVVLTSPIGSGCSAHSYCKISTPWLRAATKKLIVVCYCTYHTLHSMATTRCQLALLTPMVWWWLCLAYVIYPLNVNCG
jgi:hypothetical protein